MLLHFVLILMFIELDPFTLIVLNNEKSKNPPTDFYNKGQSVSEKKTREPTHEELHQRVEVLEKLLLQKGTSPTTDNLSRYYRQDTTRQ